MRCSFLKSVLENITCATVRMADGTVVRTTGQTDLRDIQFGEDSYALEELVDPASLKQPEPEPLPEPLPEPVPEPELAPVTVEAVAAEEPAVEPEPAPAPEPEPEPEPVPVLSFLPMEEVAVLAVALDEPEPEPEPEPTGPSEAEKAAKYILRLVLNLVDKEIDRKKNMRKVTEVVALQFRTSTRKKRESTAPAKKLGLPVNMCTNRPLYGLHTPRGGPPIGARPDGSPARGLQNGSSTHRPVPPPRRTQLLQRSRPDGDFGVLTDRLLSTVASTAAATASGAFGDSGRPWQPARPLKLIRGGTMVGVAPATPPPSANYGRLPPVETVETTHGESTAAHSETMAHSETVFAAARSVCLS